jgi:hypothetical protein
VAGAPPSDPRPFAVCRHRGHGHRSASPRSGPHGLGLPTVCVPHAFELAAAVVDGHPPRTHQKAPRTQSPLSHPARPPAHSPGRPPAHPPGRPLTRPPARPHARTPILSIHRRCLDEARQDRAALGRHAAGMSSCDHASTANQQDLRRAGAGPLNGGRTRRQLNVGRSRVAHRRAGAGRLSGRRIGGVSDAQTRPARAWSAARPPSHTPRPRTDVSSNGTTLVPHSAQSKSRCPTVRRARAGAPQCAEQEPVPHSAQSKNRCPTVRRARCRRVRSGGGRVRRGRRPPPRRVCRGR